MLPGRPERRAHLGRNGLPFQHPTLEIFKRDKECEYAFAIYCEGILYEDARFPAISIFRVKYEDRGGISIACADQPPVDAEVV